MTLQNCRDTKTKKAFKYIPFIDVKLQKILHALVFDAQEVTFVQEINRKI